MSGAEELLSAFLESFDVAALGASLGPDLAAKAIADLPYLGAAHRADLEGLLASAACEGVARFCSAAELRLSIEGPGEDPSYEALAATIENVRAALARICPPPELELTREQREAMAAEAIERLAGIVVSWDRSRADAEDEAGDHYAPGAPNPDG